MLIHVEKAVDGELIPTSVSKDDPLPTEAQNGTSTALEVQAGRQHLVRATKAAVAAEFARIQIYNAGTVPIHVGTVQVWGGTAGTHTYSVYEVANHAEGSPLSGVTVNCKLGDPVHSSVEVYGASSAVAIPTTGLFGQIASAVITPGGAAVLQSGIQIAIPPGKTLEFAISTLNVAFSISVAVDVLS